MALKEYTYTPGSTGDGIETTVLLDDEDAKRLGLTGGKSVKPENKQATPADKSAASKPSSVSSK